MAHRDIAAMVHEKHQSATGGRRPSRSVTSGSRVCASAGEKQSHQQLQHQKPELMIGDIRAPRPPHAIGDIREPSVRRDARRVRRRARESDVVARGDQRERRVPRGGEALEAGLSALDSGLLALSVPEIGIRLAVGAEPRHTLLMAVDAAHIVDGCRKDALTSPADHSSRSRRPRRLTPGPCMQPPIAPPAVTMRRDHLPGLVPEAAPARLAVRRV
jgi:hypothetical protein